MLSLHTTNNAQGAFETSPQRTEDRDKFEPAPKQVVRASSDSGLICGGAGFAPCFTTALQPDRYSSGRKFENIFLV